MNQFLNLLSRILFWITFGPIRDRRNKVRRRANYEFLKAKISERHFAGYAGLVVDFKDRKFDLVDLASFRPPMYGAMMVKNKDGHWCIFWDRARMTREIGTGGPIKDGEILIPDTVGRTKPSETLETIDNQESLTRQEETSDGTPSEEV